MLNINDLKDLEKYKCKKIDITEVNVAENEKERELIYQPELPLKDRKDLFFSNYDDESLKDFKIVMKTFKSDLLLPISYEHRDQYYPSYSNLIDYSVKYQALFLLQIDVLHGKKVLKHSDEQHFHSIYLNTENLYFIYDFENKNGPRWKRTSKKEEWEKLRKELDSFKKGPKAVSIYEKYFEAIEKLKNKKLFELNYEDVLNSLLDFYKFKNLYNELDDQHYKFLKSEIESKLETLKKVLSLDPNSNARIQNSNVLHTELNRLGFYIGDHEAYPSILQFHIFTQKSDEFRNEESIRVLKKSIFNYAKTIEKRDLEPVLFMETNDVNFQIEYKKVIKK